MKRVLFVIMSLHMAGAERSLINLLSEFDYEQYQVDLLLIKKRGELLPQLPKEVNLIETPFELMSLFSNKIHGFQGLKYFVIRLLSVVYSNLSCIIHTAEVTALRWNRFYDRQVPSLDSEYDAAIAYLPGPSMYYIANKVKAKKKIVFIHNDYIASNATVGTATDRVFFEKFDAIATISEKCLKSLQLTFPEFNSKFSVIPNVSSTRLIRTRAGEFVPVEYDQKENIILSVGRLCQQKAFDLAIQAAAILKSKGLSFTWFIIGEGKDRKALDAMISKSNLQESVQLLGIRDNPYPYILNATVIAQTSRYEGKSMVLDEAKILAKPILSTNYSTVKDQLTEQEGLVVDMTPEGVADGLYYMLTNPSCRENYSQYLCSQNYGNTSEIEKLYRILL